MTEQILCRELQTELDLVKALLNAVRARVRAPIFGSLSEILLREKLRAERYGRHFAVVLMVFDRARDDMELQALGNCVRASDLFGMVDGGGSSLPDHLSKALGSLDEAVKALGGQVLVAILPETDREGAQVVAGRLEAHVRENLHFRIGTAVYPDDAAELEPLLAVAAGGASAAG